MKLLVLFAAVLVCVAGQDCRPTNFYALRHTRRLDAGVDTRTEEDAVLMNEGRSNAIALRDEFLKGLPVGHIFVTHTTYSYQVAMPLALATGIPITSYNIGVINDTNPNPDLAAKIGRLNPCPNDILIVSHGFQLAGVLNTVGYTGPPINEIGQFQRLYNVRILPDGSDRLTISYFGPPGTDQSNGPLPCGENVRTFDELRAGVKDSTIITESSYNKTNTGQCRPSTYHMVRHANRYSLGITTISQEDAVLIQEGRDRSDDLRDKITTTHEVGHILISQTAYTYQTAMPLAQFSGLPMTVHFWGTPTDQSDFALKVSNLDPCPDTILVVNHGAFLQAVMREIGYTGPNIGNIGLYGRFYTLRFLPDGSDEISFDTYGPPCVLCDNQPLPADCNP